LVTSPAEPSGDSGSYQAGPKGAKPQMVPAMDPDYPPPQYLPRLPDLSRTSDQKRKRKRHGQKWACPFHWRL